MSSNRFWLFKWNLTKCFLFQHFINLWSHPILHKVNSLNLTWSTFNPNNRSTSSIICHQARVSNDEWFHFRRKGSCQCSCSSTSLPRLAFCFWLQSKWIFDCGSLVTKLGSISPEFQNGITFIQCPNVTRKSNGFIVIVIEKSKQSSINQFSTLADGIITQTTFLCIVQGVFLSPSEELCYIDHRLWQISVIGTQGNLC